MTITSTAIKRHRARITSQGQITLPKAVREQLGVKAGDDVEFEPGPNGMLIRPRPRRSVLDFAGIAAESAHLLPATAEELDELLAEGRGRELAAKMARIAEGRRSDQ